MATDRLRRLLVLPLNLMLTHRKIRRCRCELLIEQSKGNLMISYRDSGVLQQLSKPADTRGGATERHQKCKSHTRRSDETHSDCSMGLLISVKCSLLLFFFFKLSHVYRLLLVFCSRFSGLTVPQKPYFGPRWFWTTGLSVTTLSPRFVRFHNRAHVSQCIATNLNVSVCYYYLNSYFC